MRPLRAITLHRRLNAREQLRPEAASWAHPPSTLHRRLNAREQLPSILGSPSPRISCSPSQAQRPRTATPPGSDLLPFRNPLSIAGSTPANSYLITTLAGAPSNAGVSPSQAQRPRTATPGASAFAPAAIPPLHRRLNAREQLLWWLARPWGIEPTLHRRLNAREQLPSLISRRIKTSIISPSQAQRPRTATRNDAPNNRNPNNPLHRRLNAREQLRPP